jgi:hypothetical protein
MYLVGIMKIEIEEAQLEPRYSLIRSIHSSTFSKTKSFHTLSEPNQHVVCQSPLPRRSRLRVSTTNYKNIEPAVPTRSSTSALAAPASAAVGNNTTTKAIQNVTSAQAIHNICSGIPTRNRHQQIEHVSGGPWDLEQVLILGHSECEEDR